MFLRNLQAVVAQRGQGAGGAAELQRQAPRRAAVSGRALERLSAAAYSASFSPNGIGSACCSQVRATMAVVAMLPCQPGKA